MQNPASALTLIGPSQVMVGFCVSSTVTICEQVAVLPLPSVTVQVTVLGPATRLAGEAITLATLQLSATVVGAVNCELA